MISLDYWAIICNIINIIILFLLLKKFLFKPVTQIMEKRRDLIENSLSKAEQREQDANALHERYENELQQSRSTADEIIGRAKDKAQNEYDKIIAEAKAEAEKYLETAKKDFEIEKRHEMEKMQESIVEIAILAAIKASEESIDKEKSKKLLEELVMKAGA